MDDLVAFICARLDEDEANARDALALWPDTHFTIDPGSLVIVEFQRRRDPARVLREVEGARNILARYEDCLARMEDPDYPQAVARDQAREYEDFVLPNLTAAWSGHPDYDAEWRPPGTTSS